MKWTFSRIPLLGVAFLLCAANARIITVTTTNNVNPGITETSLYQAISSLAHGDEIRFNIPGEGVHTITTPIGGYPVITATNVTIDGYSQPAAAPNTNPILGGNNARIKIVLDSSDPAATVGGYPDNPTNTMRRSTRLLFSGYGTSENAILGVVGGENFKVRGVSFLGRQTEGSDSDPKMYCIALVQGAKNARVQGCWFGLPPGGAAQADVKGCGAAIAAFRYQDAEDVYSSGLVVGTDGDGVNDVAEFNVIVGMHIALALEAPQVRVAGNYFNVFPDGKTFFDGEQLNTDLLALGLSGDDASVETIENGRVTDDTVIGTNGDGVSDENERNIFAHSIYDYDILFYSSARNVVVAGNYFGVGVDGTTTGPVPTSATPALLWLPGDASLRLGSNGDGVSDAVEGNLIVNLPGTRLVESGASVPLVVRRNTLVGSAITGFPFPESDSVSYENYYWDALLDSTGATSPTLLASTNGFLAGTLPAPNTKNYAQHVVDLYLVDGMAIQTNSPLPGTWVGSFVEGSGQDLDPAPNAFRVSLARLGLNDGDELVLAVTYAQAANKTEATNAVTGPLSSAVAARVPSVGEAPPLSIVKAGNQATLSWPTAAVGFTLESKTDLREANWTAVGALNPTTVGSGAGTKFFRLRK